jgi:hypothetical protein
MRNSILSLSVSSAVLAILAASPLSALAGQDRGGGQIVDIGKNQVLRDFVDSTNCEWVEAEDIVAKLEHFPRILDTLRPLHWYFAKLVETEPRNLMVCETQGRLTNVPTEDIDGVGVVSLKGAKPIAVRINNTVFLDKATFKRLDSVTQAYVFFHEIMHSFIDWKEEMRNTKLRSFVATVRKQETNPMSSEYFLLQMRQNGITIPVEAPALKHDPSTFDEVLDLRLDLKTRVTAALRLCPSQLRMSSLNTERTIDCSSSLGRTSYGDTWFGIETTQLIEKYVKSISFSTLKALIRNDVQTVRNIIRSSGLIMDFRVEVGSFEKSTKLAILDHWMSGKMRSDFHSLEFQFTPLSIAVVNGSLPMVQLILNADPTRADEAIDFRGCILNKEFACSWEGPLQNFASQLEYENIAAAIGRTKAKNLTESALFR